MEPDLLEGDRLLVDPRAFRRRAPRAGEIVVLRDPEDPTRLLVKAVGPGDADGASSGSPLDGLRSPARAAAIGGSSASVVVVSRRIDEGRDSRRFGPVPLDRLVGLVWYRYAPRHRRGPIPTGPGAPER